MEEDTESLGSPRYRLEVDISSLDELGALDATDLVEETMAFLLERCNSCTLNRRKLMGFK
jgi:hypothetical protein